MYLIIFVNENKLDTEDEI